MTVHKTAAMQPNCNYCDPAQEVLASLNHLEQTVTWKQTAFVASDPQPMFLQMLKQKVSCHFCHLCFRKCKMEGGTHMGEGRVHSWVSSPSRGPIWAFVGSVSFSRLPWQCSRGVLVLSPTTRTTSMFCIHQVLKQKPSAQSPTDWATATLGNKLFYVNETIAFIAFEGIRWNCLLLLCKTTWVLL